MKKIYLILIAQFILISVLRAQNVPVDLHTGQPIISIPVYNIEASDVSMPVNLFYEAGVKAYQQNGNDEYNIGVGWRVNAGGNITRTVKSLPDDYYLGGNTDSRIGWLFGNNSNLIANFLPQSRTNCGSDASNYNFLNGMVDGNADTEPDVFSFNFNGYSGQFVFDNNHVLQVMPYQDLKIIPAYATNGSIISFKIITNQGVQYNFMPSTKVTMSVAPVGSSDGILYERDKLIKYQQQISYTTQWSLSSIVSKTGRMINLQYQSLEETRPLITYRNIYLSDNSINTAYKRSLYTTTIRETHQKLIGISTNECSLYLGYRTGFDRLDNFTVKINGTTVLLVALNFSYANGRTFLKAVQSSNSCLKNPPYSFDYLGTDFSYDGISILPSSTRGSAPCNGCLLPQQPQQDYWGYYNYNKSSTLVPNLWVYPNEPAAERYRLEQIPGYTGPNYQLAGGADRRPNPDVIAAGSLSRIQYPTGGSVLLSYEPNQYFDAKANQNFNGGGIRVKSVTVHDGVNSANDMVKTYSFSGGVLVNRPQFAYSTPVYTDPAGSTTTVEGYIDQATQIAYFTARSEFDLNSYSFDSPNVEYRSVQELQAGKGKVVYEYSNPTTYGQAAGSENIGTEPWQATYSRYATTVNPATQACMAQGLLGDGYYAYPYPDNSNYNFSRGLLTSVKAYNENGQLVKETRYEYTNIFKNSAPDLVYGLAYDYFTYNNDIYTKAFVYGKYKLYANTNKFLTKVIEKTYDPGTNYVKSTTAETNDAYVGANHTLLSSSTTSTTNDGVNFTTYKTKYTYPEDYVTVNAYDSTVLALQILKDQHINGIVVEKINIMTKPGQAEQVVGADLNLFNKYPNSVSQNVYLSKQMSFRTNTPITNFSPFVVESAAISHRDSRYETINNYVNYGDYGELNSVADNRNNRSGLLYDNARSLVIAKVSNAFANQVVYSNFDEEHGGVGGWTSNSFYYVFTPPIEFSSVNGRIGKALSVGANFTFQKIGLTKGIGNSYDFSCWVKSNSSGFLLLTLADAGGHNVTRSITLTNNTGVWTNYKVTVPVETLNATFDISVRTSNAVIVDDMLFHPQLAPVSLTSYQDLLQVATTDSHGNTTFYNYDALRRPTLVLDQNQNILKRTAYNYNVTYELNASFNFPMKMYASSSTQFRTGPADGCEPVGIIRDWNFGDGTVLQNGGANPSHNYASTGNYTVTLTVHNGQYGTVTSQQQIYVEPPLEPSLKFELQACGIVVYEVCSKRAVFYGNSYDGPCPVYPVGTNVFTAHIEQACSSNVGFAWQMAYDNAPDTWISLQGGQSITVNVPLDADGSVSTNKSYTIKCVMYPMGCNAQSDTQTYHINYFASGCNR
jgi:hypothetical protein